MATGKKGTEEPIVRGMYQVPMPWRQAVVRTAEDGVGFVPGSYTMHTGQHWVLLYFYTATRVRLGRPDTEWVNGDAGSAVLIPCYTDYTVDTRGPKHAPPVHHAWATMQQLEASPILAMLQNASGMARFIDTAGVLSRQLGALIDVAERLKHKAFWPMQYALQPLLQSLERATPLECGVFEIKARPTTTLAETLVPGVVTYLHDKMADGVSTEGLAKHLRLSVSTVSHQYRKITGETPMQTLRRLRIQQLKAHLVEGWSLDAAAHGVGFYDAHHASREFKRSEGISPSGFMSMVRNSAA